ncbi:MAG: hypothetical protein ABI597_08335 [Gammaproteobacteria bacterium]
MRVLILNTIFLALLPHLLLASTAEKINIECKIIDSSLYTSKAMNQVPPSDNDFGAPELNDKLIFSVSEFKKKVAIMNGWGTNFIERTADSTTIETQPDSFVIRTYYRSEPSNPSNKAMALDYIYQINRISGKLFIQKYAPDTSWQPYYKLGDKMWTANGQCSPFVVKF